MCNRPQGQLNASPGQQQPTFQPPRFNPMTLNQGAPGHFQQWPIGQPNPYEQGYASGSTGSGEPAYGQPANPAANPVNPFGPVNPGVNPNGAMVHPLLARRNLGR